MKSSNQVMPKQFKHAHFALNVVVLVLFALASCTSKNPFPLSEQGSYDFGTWGDFSNLYVFTDTRRNNREVSIMVWYPAKLPEDAEPSTYNIDAEPDRSGAPCPLVLSSAKTGSIFGPHLASHGFIVVGIS